MNEFTQQQVTETLDTLRAGIKHREELISIVSIIAALFGGAVMVATFETDLTYANIASIVFFALWMIWLLANLDGQNIVARRTIGAILEESTKLGNAKWALVFAQEVAKSDNRN